MQFNIVIPARYASSRLPAKPLLNLGGKPMVVRVAERVMSCGAQQVVVATDHAEIMSACKAHDVDVVMTKAEHATGTDRIAEVANQYGWSEDSIVLNVQGDEPLIDPVIVSETAAQLVRSGADIATVAHPIYDAAEFFNPNIVKVVCSANQDALYFSRAPIPYARKEFANITNGQASDLPEQFLALRHVGLYAYRVGFLNVYGQLEHAAIEGFELLEQLRALWHGYRISVLRIEEAPALGVDTPEDVARVQQLFIGC